MRMEVGNRKSEVGSIYEDDALVDQVTRQALERTNSRLLQIHRFDASEDKHVEELLRIFDPHKGNRIADVGCGVGRLAELMSQRRPDLDFTLINRSASQLSMCPPGFKAMYGLAENLPILRGEFNAIMATYVLGHVDLARFVSECQRVLGPKDRIYLYDLFRRDDRKPCRLKQDLNYTARTVEEMAEAFVAGGFTKMDCTHYAYFVPKEIRALMPHPTTLRNTLSAAMVFRK